jgi:uncharacterized membrane protein
VAAAAGYAAYGLFRHWHFGSGFDLAIFDQAVWHLSRFETPVSSVRRVDNIFGDHFHPIIGLFAPLYWIVPAPETLIVAQAVLLAASIVPVFVYARRRLPHRAALLLSAAYALFWGLQRTAATDVHEAAFAPLVVAGAILAMEHRRWGLLWSCAAGIVIVKEDMPPFVIALGLLLAARGERRRGLLLAGCGTAAFLLVLRVAIPWLNDGPWGYAGPYDAFWQRPWMAPLIILTPLQKLRTVVSWLAPFVCLPLASPLIVLAIPIALERLLSSLPEHWIAAGHYSAPIAPVLAMAAADGLARLTARRVIATTVTALALVVSAIVPGHQPLLRVLNPRHYRRLPTAAAAAQALALIPRDASVVAQTAIAPHLSERPAIFILDDSAPAADYVIAAAPLDPWPITTADVDALLAARRAAGYRVIFERDGWLVLRR